MFKLVDTTLFNGGDRNIVFCHTTDESMVNLFRRSLLSEIPTWGIDVVIFNRNNSARTDEIIALKLAQLVINQKQFVDKYAEQLQQNIDIRVRINVSGPSVFSTSDIPLPFTYVTPIMELREGEYLVFDVIVRQGTGYDHVKWRPVSTIFFNMVSVVDGQLVAWNNNKITHTEKDSLYGLTMDTFEKYQDIIRKQKIKTENFIILEYKGIGMYESDVLFDLGIKNINAASERPISSIFSNTYIPADFDEKLTELLNSQKTFGNYYSEFAKEESPDIKSPKGRRRAPLQPVISSIDTSSSSTNTSKNKSTRSNRR